MHSIWNKKLNAIKNVALQKQNKVYQKVNLFFEKDFYDSLI
jgi:hypothetical protein